MRVPKRRVTAVVWKLKLAERNSGERKSYRPRCSPVETRTFFACRTMGHDLECCTMPETPEQKARRVIDENLTAAGWLVQSSDELDLTAGRGIAVREFQMKTGFGFADYLLYLDRKALGAIEAKPEGTLTGVEAQSAKYAAGL